MTDTAELFRFEVPTSMGHFVIIGPDTLPAEEAAKVGAQIARLLPLMLLEPEPEPEPVNDRNWVPQNDPDLEAMQKPRPLSGGTE